MARVVSVYPLSHPLVNYLGVSCRQQIEHGTGRKARHWVEVMANVTRAE